MAIFHQFDDAIGSGSMGRLCATQAYQAVYSINQKQNHGRYVEGDSAERINFAVVHQNE